jgi:hypothetical protein
MPPVSSKPERADKGAERIQNHVLSFPLPVAFGKSKRANGKHDTTDYREFEMSFDPCDENTQKMTKSVIIFEDGDEMTKCSVIEAHIKRLVPLTGML